MVFDLVDSLKFCNKPFTRICDSFKSATFLLCYGEVFRVVGVMLHFCFMWPPQLWGSAIVAHDRGSGVALHGGPPFVSHGWKHQIPIIRESAYIFLLNIVSQLGLHKVQRRNEGQTWHLTDSWYNVEMKAKHGTWQIPTKVFPFRISCASHRRARAIWFDLFTYHSAKLDFGTWTASFVFRHLKPPDHMLPTVELILFGDN